MALRRPSPRVGGPERAPHADGKTPRGARAAASIRIQGRVGRAARLSLARQTGRLHGLPAIAEADAIDRGGRVDDAASSACPRSTARRRRTTGAAVLMAAWGDDGPRASERECLRGGGDRGAGSGGLARATSFFFFAGHCRLFHQTPFVLHVTGRHQGRFSALSVPTTRSAPPTAAGGGQRLLEKLRDLRISANGIGGATFSAAFVASGDALAEDRLAARRSPARRGAYQQSSSASPPYDIFVRGSRPRSSRSAWEPITDIRRRRAPQHPPLS